MWKIQPILPAFLAISFAYASSQTCYWPNGEQAATDIVCPSGSDTSNSACCYANDYCLANGLCYKPSTMDFYRGGCTDQTWNSLSCPNYCMTITDDECGVMTCNYGYAACFGGTCTDNNFTIASGSLQYNEAVASDMGLLASTTSVVGPTVTVTVSGSAMLSSSATSSQSTSTSTSTSASISPPPTSTATGSSAAASTASKDQANSGQPLEIALGVGVPVVVIGVALIAALFLIKRKKRRTSQRIAKARPRETAGADHWRLESTEQISLQQASQRELVQPQAQVYQPHLHQPLQDWPVYVSPTVTQPAQEIYTHQCSELHGKSAVLSELYDKGI